MRALSISAMPCFHEEKRAQRRIGRIIQRPGVVVSSRSLLRGCWYAKGAIGRWNRADQTVMGMRWNHYISSGKSTPFSMHALQPLPPFSEGRMDCMDACKANGHNPRGKQSRIPDGGQSGKNRHHHAASPGRPAFSFEAPSGFRAPAHVAQPAAPAEIPDEAPGVSAAPPKRDEDGCSLPEAAQCFIAAPPGTGRAPNAPKMQAATVPATEETFPARMIDALISMIDAGRSAVLSALPFRNGRPPSQQMARPAAFNELESVPGPIIQNTKRGTAKPEALEPPIRQSRNGNAGAMQAHKSQGAKSRAMAAAGVPAEFLPQNSGAMALANPRPAKNPYFDSGQKRVVQLKVARADAQPEG